MKQQRELAHKSPVGARQVPSEICLVRAVELQEFQSFQRLLLDILM